MCPQRGGAVRPPLDWNSTASSTGRAIGPFSRNCASRSSRADEPEERSAAAPVRRLRRLARLLPPARDLYREPAKLAALQAWAAVADPALSMAALIHYQLCLGSLVMLSPDPDRLKNVFEALETGRVKGCYLITEVGSANSHLATRTEAGWDPQTGASCSTRRTRVPPSSAARARPGAPRSRSSWPA
jgi:hypothetical protein